MEIVDGQLHANQFGPNWKTVGLEATLLATIIAMDAVGVKAAVLDEYVGQDKNFHMLPGHYEANGAYRPERPFSELAMEFLKMAEPIARGVATGEWVSSEALAPPRTKAELLALWDHATTAINTIWPAIPPMDASTPES